MSEADMFKWIANQSPKTEDFALMEASYAIVRILQTFPNIRLPAGVPNEPVGSEQQNLTIVLSSANGCTVLLK